MRVLSNVTTEDFDPFLMLDAFDSTHHEEYEKGFPWHPHRGIETVTYLIEGEMTHGDSLGNEGLIKSGEYQWMTAGNGIIHQEYPQPTKRMLGSQLWINLPQKYKMVEPNYHAITATNIPVIEEKGSIVRVLAGNYEHVKAPLTGQYVETTYLDVTLDKK
ncbi:pirin family protein [endosymbiont 'TC1' of Trimyema compressum]|uniref:pirin family protein n=1 Tax=endosymbiont 'TC1' of Trimyema compressum TaxID=243899 RepID=UPI000AC20C05